MKYVGAKAYLLGGLFVAGCTAGSEGWSTSSELPYGNPCDVDPGSCTTPTPQPASTSGAPLGPAPSYGATTTLAHSPPPISGGTLLLSQDGVHAIAADSDRDQIYDVNLQTHAVQTIPLGAGDEPGRVAEDTLGQAHVVLRRGGAIATIDIATGALLARRTVCTTPRGIAYDRAGARLVIACESGEVISLSPRISGAPTTLTTLAPGLRDVVVNEPFNGDASNTTIFVSRFRTAELMELTSNGALAMTRSPPGGPVTLAWRMLAAPANATSPMPIVLHQLASSAPVNPSAGGYGVASPTPGACTGTPIVRAAINDAAGDLVLPDQAVVPIDFAMVPDGYAVVAAGNGHTPALPQIIQVRSDQPCGVFSTSYFLNAQPVAIAATSAISDSSRRLSLQGDFLVVQSREPAQLQLVSESTKMAVVTIPLSSTSVEDTGHTIFHSNSGAGIACASCHGEGGDDGHVWTFAGEGSRRTPSLRGTIAGTAPYHWDGKMVDVSMLADEVMTGRMSGPQLTGDQKSALQTWLFAIPEWPKLPAVETSTVSAERGKALFFSAEVGCSGCHSGPRFTNSTTVDVGTGGRFQVPPLIGVRSRAPYLHDGCAATLADRFGKCATPGHGNIAGLTRESIGDLIAYLESI